MRNTKTRNVITEEKYLVSVTCNCCDKTVKAGEKNWYELNDIHPISVIGGFYSVYPKDMEKISFDICGDCFKAWTQTFKIKPESSHISGDEL